MVAILQVLAGVIFVFTLLSIVVTEVNSLIARATRLRAKNLRSAIDNIIEDPVIRAKVYTHPLIQLVKADPVAPSQRLTREEAERIAGGAIGSVDYIEPAVFVDVVLSAIKAEADQQMYGALINVIDGMPAGAERRGLRAMAHRIVTTGQGTKELRQALPYVRDRRYRSALGRVVNEIDEEISLLGLQRSDNVALMAGIKHIEQPNLRNALTTVMYSAEDMAGARGNLETWFNTSMNSARSTYAARMKALSLAVALAFALTLNIDAVNIARALWEDPAQRQALSSELNYALQTGELQAQIDSSASDAADDIRAQTENSAGDEGAIADALGTGADIAYQLQDLEALRLPLGWTFADPAEQPLAQSDPNNLWNYLPDNNPDGWLGLLAGKLLGIAATVIAAAQGAPFWFGIVNRILRR